MHPIDIPAIERHARQLRAQEIQRLEGLFVERAKLYALLLGGSLLSVLELVSEGLRPLFSWNPQDRDTENAGPSLFERMSQGIRALLAWDTTRRHSY